MVRCARCGNWCPGPDLCEDCDKEVVNIETPYWVIAGLDNPNDPPYDEPDWNGKQDMFPDWRSRVPFPPPCPRCQASPGDVEHVGTSEQRGDEFICMPCGAILYVLHDIVTDSGRTAPPTPTYDDP